MDMLQFSAYGEGEYFDNRITDTSHVALIPNAKFEAFWDCCHLLAQKGFEEKEQFSSDTRCYAAFLKNNLGIFIYYYSATGQLQVVTEQDCSYFSYVDTPLPSCTTPQLTQLYLSDYGMSYVARLSDGRLIIIDGANVYEKDIDNLFARLQKDSPFQKPVIAAWIFTHPHSDHYFCFFPFMEKYADAVEIQKFFFHFPDADDFEHYPKLAECGKAFARYSGEQGITCSEILRRFRQQVVQLDIPVYTPHAGQCYCLGDAKLQFFSTMDDTIHCSKNINATSLMFTLELAGQRIFFGADGSFGDALLAERYGSELKSDILQVPHHGFGCGSEDGQIRGFQLIAPRIALLPVEKHLAYTSFTTYREGTNYVMTRLGIEELITGEAERTLELPYTPDPAGVYRLRQNYQHGRDDAGARTWVFTDLHTGNAEDFWFSFLNTTYLPAQITAELYFENMEKKIVRVSFPGPRLGVYRMHCLRSAQDASSAPDTTDFWEAFGIPDSIGFAIRFLSDIPIVVSHKDHVPAYRSSVI